MKNATEKVIAIIKEETKSLFSEYLTQYNEWSGKQFDRLAARTLESVLKEKGYDAKQHAKNETGRFAWRESDIQRMFPEDRPYWRHTKASNAYWSKLLKIREKGKESYIESERNKMILNYEEATRKLAERIINKGMDLDKMTTKSINFKVGDLQTTFSDGVNSVKAHTILAWGAINAPHYRYLVK